MSRFVRASLATLTFALAGPVLEAACSSTTEGIAVSISSTAPKANGPANVFVTDKGFTVKLTRGYLVTDGVEIFACTSCGVVRDAHALVREDRPRPRHGEPHAARRTVRAFAHGGSAASQAWWASSLHRRVTIAG